MQCVGEDFERRGNDHAERAQRSEMQLHHVVAADVLDHASACAGQSPVRQGNAYADEVVSRGTEALAKWPGPTCGEQPSDGVPGRVERIEWKELARLAELRLQRLESDARLHADHHVGLRVLEHAIESSRMELEVTALSRIAHCARPAASDGHHGPSSVSGLAQPPRQLHSRGRLLDRGGFHHHFASMARPVRPARRACLRVGSGKILPGFMIPSTSKASFTCCIAERSSGLKTHGMNALFSSPIPCSPDSAPPNSTTARSISSPALSTWCSTAWSRRSKRMFG